MRTQRSRTRRAPWFCLATGAVLAIALAGCSAGGDDHAGHGSTSETSSDGAGSSAAAFNDVDVMFAQMMIPHHEQAVEMSDIVLANPDTSAEVVALAEQIKDAQGPEIETLTGWLTDWGAEPADADAHDGHEMEGMLSDAELQELREATGPDVDRLFLTQMIAHHEGAVAMAVDEVDGGENPDAVALAEQIIAAQQAEIETMQGYLDEAGTATS